MCCPPSDSSRASKPFLLTSRAGLPLSSSIDKRKNRLASPLSRTFYRLSISLCLTNMTDASFFAALGAVSTSKFTPVAYYCKVKASSEVFKPFWAKTPYKGTSFMKAFQPKPGVFRPLSIGDKCSLKAVTSNWGIDPGCLVNSMG